MIHQLLPFLRLRSPLTVHPRLTLTKRPPEWREFERGWIAWYPGELDAYGRRIHENPCTVLELDGDQETLAALCSGLDLLLGRWHCNIETEHHWRFEHTGFGGPTPPRPPVYGLTPRRIQRLTEISGLLLSKKEGRRDRIGVRHWHAACHTAVGIDSVLAGITALEALLLGSTGDMRLRLALRAAGVVAKKDQPSVFKQVYAAYGLRSSFVHGVDIPEVGREAQLEYLDAITRVVNTWLRKGRPKEKNTLEMKVIPWLAELREGD